jgi:hypothetical protein
VYDIAHVSRSTGPQVQRVAIVGEPCHFGGAQWFWLCPATGRRVRNLYLPNGGTRFLSRDAYSLRWPTTCSTAGEEPHLAAVPTPAILRGAVLRLLRGFSRACRPILHERASYDRLD